MLTSIEVKFIFDIARLGLFSSANILQIAHVALLAVLAMLLAIISPSSHSCKKGVKSAVKCPPFFVFTTKTTQPRPTLGLLG